jgi:hypothetical protein
LDAWILRVARLHVACLLLLHVSWLLLLHVSWLLLLGTWLYENNGLSLVVASSGCDHVLLRPLHATAQAAGDNREDDRHVAEVGDKEVQQVDVVQDHVLSK